MKQLSILFAYNLRYRKIYDYISLRNIHNPTKKTKRKIIGVKMKYLSTSLKSLATGVSLAVLGTLGTSR